MNKTLFFCVGVLVAAFSQASAAAAGNWSTTYNAPNVYAAQTENSNFFITPISVPKGSTVTTVSWNIGQYNNDAVLQIFKICYAARYSTVYTKCLDVSSELNSFTTHFSGLDAKGSFKIMGVLYGGHYPVYPTHKNIITVNYQ